ncbi:IPT/TIG domain-containing protein [Frankineae bacterium MT45]|nr:IPT/TIG domain-containing protein [Frankineae bacterium MT45]
MVAADKFTYGLAPTVTVTSPSVGPVAGGTTVTLTGTGFVGITNVTFGTTAGTAVTVASATKLTVVAPAHAAGLVDVRVTGSYGTSAVAAVDHYTYGPAVSAVSPRSGATTGGGTVTLTGAGFVGVTSVNFGTTAGISLTVVSATQLTVVAPAHSAGVVDIRVVGAYGTSAIATADRYTYGPAVTLVSPSTGPVTGGTRVTLTGTGFTGVTAVNFGTTAGTGINVASATSLTVTAPAHVAGLVDVRVVGTLGTSAIVSTDHFTYVPAPVVTAMSPSVGSTLGGTTVTVTGTGFTGASGVSFGGVAGSSVVVVSATSLTVVSPVHGVGVVDVQVTGPYGVSSVSAADQFTFVAPPVVSGVSPASGSTTGGKTVTITGSGFAGATGVDFGGVAGTSVTVVSATSLTVLAPAHAAGLVDVVVSGPFGSSGVVAGDRFTFVAPPVVTGVAPLTGVIAGGTKVTITGTGFTGATGVSFGGVAGTSVTVVSATSLTVLAPAHAAGVVDVQVTGPYGTSGVVAADRYTFVKVAVVSGLSPASGPVSGGTTVTVTGTGFLGASKVVFGSVAASSFVVVSDTQISAVSPAEAASAHTVYVVNAAGSSGGGAATVFTFAAAPVVSAVAPATGSSLGGSLVTVTGTGFTGASNVSFGGVAGTSVTVVSATSLTVLAPAHAAGVVDVQVTTPGGVSAVVVGDLFTYGVASAVTGVSPAAGSIIGGTLVTVTGTGFTGATGVSFGGVAGASVTVVSATKLTVVAPAGAAGVVDVQVTGPYGTSVAVAADKFTYVAPPAVTGVAPATGVIAGGTKVTITGTGFTGATGVSFGGVAGSSVTVVSATSITVTAPAHTAGVVDLQVTGPYGTSTTTTTDKYTYVKVAVVTSLSPSSGPITGGTTVTITGTGFLGTSKILFGSVTASFVVLSDTQINAVTPAEAASSHTVYVVNAAGTSAASPGAVFTFAAAPVVTAMSPSVGSTLGGTTVTVTGTGFTGASGVSFGGVAGSSVVVVSATSLTVVSPVHGVGVVDVQVTGPYGVSSVSAADQFTFVAPPVVSGVSPASGSTTGGKTVTITGSGFAGATGVDFGGVAGTSVTVVSATSLTVLAPAHAAGLVDVVVSGPFGSSGVVAGDRFTFVAPPVVTGVAPLTGVIAGGTKVTITGTGFTGATGVSFGGVAGTSVTVVSATSLTVLAPAHAAGVVDVQVTGPYGTSGVVAADRYTFVKVAVVSGLSPASGPVSGGTTVTVTGTGFLGASKVVFGSVAASSFVVVSDTQISAVSPAEAASAHTVYVVNAAGSSGGGAATVFTFAAAPVVSAVAPATGSSLGGSLVTVTGTGFTGASNVSFGGVAGTSVTVVSATSLTVLAPAHAAGVVDVQVTTPGGVSAVVVGDLFTYGVASAVTGVSPAAGSIIGGTLVTVTGTGFTGATGVSFGGVAGASVTVVSATKLTVVAPAGAAGVVDVQVTGPYGTSVAVAADKFTYVAPPAVTGVAPATGVIAGGTKVTITGTGFTGATGVSFGGVAGSSVTVVSATSITVTAPAHTAGVVDLQVTGPYGTSTTTTTDKYTYVSGPAITAISPSSGSTTGGSTITIAGTGLTGATSVNFGATAGSSLTVVSATSLTVVAPAHVAGVVDVQIVGPYGTSPVVVADQYTYAVLPVISTISPTSGTTAGGTTVTITGTGFSSATKVAFGTTSATSYAVISDTQITATAPAQPAGTQDILVTGPGGTSAPGLPDVFTYVSPPTVTTVSPATGTAVGGTTVTVTGTGFTGATVVSFGGVAATSISIASSTSLTAVTPVHATGAVDVQVTGPYGSSAAVTGDKYTFVDVTAPAPVTGMTATPGSTSVVLTWTNPTDADFTGVMIRRAAGSTPPATATAGTLVKNTSAPLTSYTDTGLAGSTTYSYALFAHDGIPNYAAAATVKVTTTCVPGPKHVSGTLTANTTWASSSCVTAYVLDNTVVVPLGRTLVLQAGAIVKATNGSYLSVQGSLVVSGTVAAPVVLTSWRDDSVGGDTNGDGSATGPAAGDWGGITVSPAGNGNPDPTISVTGLKLAYGTTGLSVSQSTVSVTNSVFTKLTGDGVDVSDADDVPTITGNTVTAVAGNAVSVYGSSLDMGKLSGNSGSGNVLNGVVLSNDTVTVSSALPWGGTLVPVLQNGCASALTVPVGVTLTLGAGTVIKAENNCGSYLSVQGSLVVSGTVAAPVVLTSWRDDSVGGDTNGDGSATGPAAGDWGGITVSPAGNGNPDPTISVTGLKLAYGTTGLSVSQSTVSVTNSVFTKLTGDGVDVSDADDVPTITGNTVTAVAGNAVSVYGSSLDMGKLSGNSGSGNVLNGVVLSNDTVTVSSALPWGGTLVPVLQNGCASALTVPVGVTLTLGAGTVIKAENNCGSYLSVQGSLVVSGTVAAPVVLTSWRDDSVGGDTNGDGSATGPAAGDWGGITVSPAGNGNPDPTISVTGLKLAYGTTGLSVSQSTVSVTNSVFTKLTGDGVDVSDADDVPTITGNTVTAVAGNAVSVYGSSLDMGKLSGNSGSGNVLNGVVLSNDTVTVSSALPWGGTLVPVLQNGCASALTVPVGVTLTLGAGTVIKAENNCGSYLSVQGSLVVSGTVAAPVVLTSWRDDSVGGDTNGDGSATGPAAGDWGGITVSPAGNGNPDPTISVTGLKLAYGTTGLSVSQSTVSVTNSVFTKLTGDGVDVSDADDVPTITGNTVTAVAGNAVSVYGSSLDMGKLSGNSGSGNVLNGVVLSNDTVTVSSALPWGGTLVPVLQNGCASALTVPVGVTLTLGAGTVIKAENNCGSYLSVQGSLVVSGTVAAPVVLTSWRDDSVGGDTNGDGSATGPAAGDWGGITVSPAGNGNPDPTISVTGLKLAYGTTGLSVSQSTVSVTNSVFTKLTGDGVDVSDADDVPTITGNTVTAVAGNAIAVASSNIDFGALGGNSGSSDGINGVVLNNDTVTVSNTVTWTGTLLPYNVGGLTIAAGVSLTLGGGTIVKSLQAGIYVEGELAANASAANPVVFTSALDDSFGGDTNDDGTATVPTVGDWPGISVTGVGQLQLAGVDIMYASTAASIVDQSPDGSVIPSFITSAYIVNNGEVLQVAGSSSVALRGTVHNFQTGIAACDWQGSCSVDATYVDWGTAGPFGAGGQTNVCGSVQVAPWTGEAAGSSPSDPFIGNCDGSETPDSQLSDAEQAYGQHLSELEELCELSQDACQAVQTYQSCVSAAMGLASAGSTFPIVQSPGDLALPAAQSAGQLLENSARQIVSDIGYVLDYGAQVIGVVQIFGALINAYETCG